ncbi:putative flavin-containing monoamine oxidase A [Brachionus plicatilis]|uniref:Amine oxidase n=1 Tax=Brachionus plicatilis TaxID=10195 RepID=A0A3M7RWE0_BRAPC|nr:putative flavin-containing monoamine oxidase A [Brachionus plicatilis]
MDNQENAEPENKTKSENVQESNELQNENYVLINEDEENDSPVSSVSNEFIKNESCNSQNNQFIYDVIIIGAGLSGLYSAYYLTKKCNDLRILVIEGKDRLGGRTQSADLKCSEDGQKSKWDLGGQWVTDTQTHITKLLVELDLETYPQHIEGKKILETNGKMVNYNSSIPSVSILSLIDLQMGSMKISSNAKKISTIDPFENLNLASRLDSGNLDEFLLSKSFSSKSRSLLDPAIRTIFGVEASQINALFGLMYIKSGGGSLESLALSDKGCAQEKKVKGGTQQISERLAQIIKNNEKNKILLNTVLIEIKQDKEKICVMAKNLSGPISFECKKVISSIPINQYVHIDFDPELPIYKRHVFQFCQMGNLIKFIVTYSKPFWREKGFSGEVVSDGSVLWSKEWSNIEGVEIPKSGPIACVFDGTNDQGQAALVGFIGAKMAVEWTDQKDELRKQEVIEALVRYFGQEARNYLEYVEKIWAKEKFAGGCPTCNLSSSGVMQNYARAVREPFMNIHFCGTESATVWQGYMDGAIQSGERAANEVLYVLFKDDRSIDYDYENTFYFHNEMNRKNSISK